MSGRLTRTVLFSSILTAATPLAGQEAAPDDHGDDDHHFHHNHLAIFIGGTTPLDQEEGGKTSFTIGADYERRFTPVVGVIALVDLAFGDHKRTALFAAELAVRPIEALRIAAGPGFELVEKEELSNGSTTTKNKVFVVIVTRANYEFHIGKLSLSPTIGWDFVGETKTNVVYGLAVGVGF